jgi:diphosphomevalonate decarboxylase
LEERRIQWVFHPDPEAQRHTMTPLPSPSLASRTRATARAHPNIALSKYWGKREHGHNLPAVPSLSVTLAGMATTTTVTFDQRLEADHFTLGGERAPTAATKRVAALLDRVRSAAGIEARAEIVSANDFPTAAGLASSASAFAALALAATRAAGLDWDDVKVSDLARKSSVSAARSVFGGFVELRAGAGEPPGDDELSAAPVVGPDHLPLRVIVAVTREGPKATLSTEGMLHTQRTSPFYPAWVETAPALFAQVRAAVIARDLAALGVAAEQSALRMHAAAIAACPGLLYWAGATVDVMEEVRRLRAAGLTAYFTIDAGPHVKVLTIPEHEVEIERALAALPGVRRTIRARPGGGATLIPEGTKAPT